MSALAALLTELLAVVVVGVCAHLVASRFHAVPYSVVLVCAGLATAALPVTTALPLSHDLIFLVVLPPILFAGGLRLDYAAARRNALFLGVLLLVCLPAAIFAMGVAGYLLFPYPLAVALLLAAMLYPLDPVAVLSVFESLDAPDRLLALVKTEPLFDDGLAVVFFGAFLGLYRTTLDTGTPLLALVTPRRALEFVLDVAAVSAGGVAVGAAFGFLLYAVSRHLGRDESIDFLLSVFVAYGSAVTAEHYLHVSGILAVVAASIVVGYAGQRELLTVEALDFVQSSWEQAELLANTLVYLLIGVYTHPAALVAHADLILAATALFLAARTLVVAAATWTVNRYVSEPVPWTYAPVLVWGALHTVVPIAVALSLPNALPYAGELRTVVFGVAVVSILGQGLTLPVLLRWLDLTGAATGDG